MLTSTPPFLGATAQAIMSRRFLGPPQPIENARDGVPEDLSAAVMKSLAKELPDRWQTADEFADAIAGRQPAGEFPEKPDTPDPKPEKTRRNVLLIGVVIAIVIAGVTAAWMLA
jgi:hypothetical protein